MKKFKLAFAMMLGLIVSLSTTLFFGCGEKDYTKINFNEVTHSIFYAPFYSAINLGYFEEEGLSINLTNGGGSNISMTALLNGSADMILAGPETVIYTEQGGITDKPKVFGQLTQCDGSFVVSRRGPDFDIEDLKNERIIGGRAGGMPAMTLEYAIKKHGLEIGTGTDQVNLDTSVEFNAIASAFENSDAGYCTLFEPNATTLVEAHPGQYFIVASVAELVEENIPYTCFIAKDSYLHEHSDIAEKFLRAVRKGYNFLKDCYEHDDLTAAAQSLSKSFDGMSLDGLKIAVKQYYSIDAFSTDMVMSPESLETLMRITTGAGMANKSVAYNDLVNTDIANRLRGDN